ncbi:MAG: ECF-type sigma factor [Phycisphaerales bacterium]|nr:ECF-type sigma factor [Phycisphaerales bacterium]
MKRDEEIKSLLHQFNSGDYGACHRLTELVLPEIKILAHSLLRRENKKNQHQTTSLVNATFVSIFSRKRVLPAERRLLLAYFATSMKNIVFSLRRRQRAQKRGGDKIPFSLGENDQLKEAVLSDRHLDDQLDLEDALEKLRVTYPCAYDVVMFRYFMRMTFEEISNTLEKDAKEIRRTWQFGKAFLRRILSENNLNGSNKRPN